MHVMNEQTARYQVLTGDERHSNLQNCAAFKASYERLE